MLKLKSGDELLSFSNAQGLRLIMVPVQVRAVKIYVAQPMEVALLKKKKEGMKTGSNSVYDKIDAFLTFYL